MKASNVKLAKLKTYVDCVEAIEAIEATSENFLLGSQYEWNSGGRVYLKMVAKNKIEAINRKMSKFLLEDEI